MKRNVLPSLGIAQRMILGIAAIVVMSLALATYSIYNLHLIDDANIARNRMTDARKTARSLDINVLRIIIDLQYFINEKDDKYLDDIAENREASNEQRKSLRTLTNNPETLEELDEYEKLLPQRVSIANQIISAVKANASASDIAELSRERRVLDDTAREHLRAMISIEETSSTKALEELSKEIAEARRNLIVFVAVMVTLIIVANFLLYRSIIKPLRALTKMAGTIKEGNLAVENTVDTHDELGVLGHTMNDMAHELEHVDEIKRNFISIASHQLRTPATAVKQDLALILEGYVKSDQDKAHYIQEAFDSNEEQLTIINDILSVARIEAGKVTLHRVPTNLSVLIQKVVSEQRNLLKSDQQLTYEPSSHELTLSVDESKLKMCIGNLINNAIKYTPEQGTITVSTESTNDAVHISVTDNGVGIDKKDIPKLFGKFSRVDNALSAKVGGTGLGLYLVRELVRLHSGDVGVTSTPGVGTTFIIKLPKED